MKVFRIFFLFLSFEVGEEVGFFGVGGGIL